MKKHEPDCWQSQKDHCDPDPTCTCKDAPKLVAIGVPEQHEGFGPLPAGGWLVATYFPTKEDADAFVAGLNFD